MKPKPFPCQAARATEAPQSAGTGVALKAASVPQVPGLLDERVLGCTYGHYPWDDWERTALAAGVPKSLAGLGRLTMREAYQHQWDDRLKSLCGWCDEGRRMTRLALRSPQTAEKRWQRLLDTDGYRGCWRTLPGDPPTLTWESWT
jgi:hypothetical protein